MQEERQTVQSYAAENVIHVTDFVLKNISKDNDELTRKARESLIRGLWLLGGVGIFVLRNDFQVISKIVLYQFFSVILVVICLSLIYIFYFLRIFEIDYPSYEEYCEKIIHEQDYGVVVTFYINELATVSESLLKLNQKLSAGLQWINRLSVILILLIGFTVGTFIITHFFLP